VESTRRRNLDSDDEIPKTKGLSQSRGPVEIVDGVARN
jgi:hypothetical protein